MSEKIEGGHTPGDWIGEVYEDGGFIIQGPDGAVLCQRSSWPSRARESRANGHLMLAAPELLGELKRMVEHFGVWANDWSETATTETWSALHCAKEIIRKAEQP